MTQTIGQTPVETSAITDLAAAVHSVLAASAEPLTLSKIRSQLPAPFRTVSLEELADCLHRQVAANVLCQYPKYRSRQDRFWDRSMPVHVAALLRQVLQEGALAWSELRRKLPAYARSQAESVLTEQVAQGLLHRHPRAGRRGGDRFGLQPADPKGYLRPELAKVFRHLEQFGFSQSQIRAGALELLHDEEWSPASTPTPERGPAHREPRSHEQETSTPDFSEQSSSPSPGSDNPEPAQPEVQSETQLDTQNA